MSALLNYQLYREIPFLNVLGVDNSMNAPVMVELEGETDPLEVLSLTVTTFFKSFRCLWIMSNLLLLSEES